MIGRAVVALQTRQIQVDQRIPGIAVGKGELPPGPRAPRHERIGMAGRHTPQRAVVGQRVDGEYGCDGGRLRLAGGGDHDVPGPVVGRMAFSGVFLSSIQQGST